MILSERVHVVVPLHILRVAPTDLAVHLAAEIDMHMTREVRELVQFLYAELQQVQGHKELYDFMSEFMRQEVPMMAQEMSAIRKAGVHSLFETISWSLNILPPEEHKSFWKRLFGG